MLKKILIIGLLQTTLLLPQTLFANSIEYKTQNQVIRIAAVEMDSELRQKSNLPFLRDKDNKAFENITGEERAKTLIGQIIGIVLQFLIGISVIFIILNAFKFITAAGDDSKLSEAKKSLFVLIGGLLLIFLSYSIVSFVFKTVLFVEEVGPILEEATPQTQGTTPPSSNTTPPS